MCKESTPYSPKAINFRLEDPIDRAIAWIEFERNPLLFEGVRCNIQFPDRNPVGSMPHKLRNIYLHLLPPNLCRVNALFAKAINSHLEDPIDRAIAWIEFERNPLLFEDGAMQYSISGQKSGGSMPPQTEKR
ncbi:hypothetical protein CDAR_607301 [Caerostris darwini]|uniref:Uncharacterized protein n=1 Tax=Caerostris darwini TaxID=1538125 RepID=A0AAV4NI76_9ARAC|nr:hypothetical protein CDAR_607301 [Caerostris darwini]